MKSDLIVLFEHPRWQQPLFAALERRRVRFSTLDLKNGSFDIDEPPVARLYFNQASPSAYVRGELRAVPFAQALLRCLEIGGARVLNGSRAFALELSKSAQGTLMQRLGISHPRSVLFNDVQQVRARWNLWPALLKPEQGGSGARIYAVNSADELERLLANAPSLWLPDNLFLLQEKFEVDPTRGIVRMEFLGRDLLYAMRVISNGAFNLCPSELCNPEVGGDSSCKIPSEQPITFLPYPDVTAAAVETGRRLMEAGGLDVGGIEYLEANDGRLVFYDINANSNLRPAVAKAFGFDPFERVVDFLVRQLESLDLLAAPLRAE